MKLSLLTPLIFSTCVFFACITLLIGAQVSIKLYGTKSIFCSGSILFVSPITNDLCELAEIKENVLKDERNINSISYFLLAMEEGDGSVKKMFKMLPLDEEESEALEKLKVYSL